MQGAHADAKLGSSSHLLHFPATFHLKVSQDMPGIKTVPVEREKQVLSRGES